MKITANSVGGNVVDKTYTNFYHGGYKDVTEGVSNIILFVIKESQ